MTKKPLTYGRNFLDELLLAIIAANPVEGDDATAQRRLNEARKALFGAQGEAGAPRANLNNELMGMAFLFDEAQRKGEAPQFTTSPPWKFVRELAKEALGKSPEERLGRGEAKAKIEALTAAFIENFDSVMKWADSNFEVEQADYKDLRAIEAIFQKHGVKMKIYGLEDLRPGSKKRAPRSPRTRA